METGGGKLIAADESTVIAESFLDAFVVKDSESNRSFPDPSCTDESEGFDIFCDSKDLLDQLVPTKTSAWWRGRKFPRRSTALT